MRHTATLLSLLAVLALHAQPFSWQWSVRDTSTLSSPDIMGFATDAQGNSYVAGIFYGTATFGTLPPITSMGQSDVYVVKYDDQGVAQWAVRAGGTDFDNPYDLAIDGNGGVYITGSYQSSTAGFGGTTLALTGAMDIFVAKLSAANGGFAWAKRYGSNDFQADNREWGRAITCDTEGNVYVTGCFKYSLAVPGLPQLDGCSQYYNSFMLKLDADGNGIWSRRPDCGRHWSYSASEGQAITVGADGMLYAGFRARGDTLFFEGDTLLNIQTSGQAHDVVLVKYGLDGTPQWTKVIGGYGYDDAQVLQADAEGHLYAAIHREGGYGHLGVLNIEVAGSLGIYRNVIFKIAPDGHFIWGTRLGNSTYDHDIEALQLEGAENLLVGGWHQGNFEVGGIVPNPGVSGNYGLYLARFDSSSTMTDLLAQRYTYPRGIRGIGRDGVGNIYVGGYFQDSLALGGLPAMQLANASNGAMFLARSGDFSTGLAPDMDEASISAFPVPSTGSVTITSARDFDGLALTDPLGRRVFAASFAPARQRTVELPLEGVFLCTLLRDGERVGTCRVVLDR